ncbi:MAG: CDP-glycerol glycerophosphotransferase family protein [Candidatus Saccharibacteria bacterium]
MLQKLKNLIKLFIKLIKMDKRRIILFYQSYSGSNAIALYKLMPDWAAEKYDIRLVRDVKPGPFKELIRYYLDLARCSLIVTTHGKRKVRDDQTEIELWHGFPLKAMGVMDRGLPQSEKDLTVKLMNQIDVFASYSQFYSTLMAACCGIDGSRFEITGVPRNDLLFRRGREALQKVLEQDLAQDKIIFFMPTFRLGYENREEGSKDWNNIFGFNEFNHDGFDNFLRENSLRIIAKLHPFEEAKMAAHMTQKADSRIIFLQDGDLEKNNYDLYEVLGAADILVTDYSSVYFDFLLLDRPLIFIPVDLNRYRGSRGLLLEPYEHWTPGPTALDQEVFAREILNSLQDNQYYSRERNILRDIVHRHHDDQSALRIWELIDRMLDKRAESL